MCTSLTLSSDHFLIQTIVDLAPSRVRVRQIPDWAATDWRHFSAMLQSTLGLAPSQPLPSTEAVDVAVDYLTACVQLTTATVVPKKRVCSYSRPWWHPGLTDLRRDMHHWHRRWLRSGRVFARERYLLARRAFRTAIVTAKRDSWRRLCSETSRADLWSLYRKFSRKGDYSVVDTLELDGRVVSADTDKASALAPVFFPSLPPVSDRRQADIDHSWSTYRPPGVPGFVEVSIAEVVLAVRQMRPKAAPGLDDIPVSVLKENLYIIAPWLALIYTASLSLHYFPESWKTAKVIPLKKPGKSSYSTPRSYRPISLLSHLGKALERIVNQRLMRQLESRCLLSPFQFGFRAGRQAVSACLRITEDIYSAFRCGQQVQAVALDLQSAYDTVWRAGLLEKLSAMGVDWYIICWVQSFLEGRMARLVVGESAVEVATSCGVPQGSPISPTLFLVFIDDLLRRLQHLGRLRFQGFADDMILWIMGYLRYGRIHPCLRHALWRAERWSRFWRIRFSPKKCECITFAGKSVAVEGRFEAFLYGEPIPHTRVLRYLGVWFDERLTWHRHIREAVTRVTSTLWSIRRSVGTDWGLQCQLFLRLVRGVALPSLFYGAPCWASVVSVGARLEELDRVLATASRMAFSLERFTSTEGSLVLGGLSPARLHILRSLVRYLFRYRRAELIRDLPSSVHRSYATPVEIGRAWFRRAVLARSSVDPLRSRPRLVLDHIDTALRAEWRRRWHAADTGRFLHDLFEDAGEAWMPEDIARCRRPEMVQVARFMTGHCHLGNFCLPREDHSEDCPLCGEPYSRIHFLTECEALADLRSQWLAPSAWGRGGLRGLVWRDCFRFGRFLMGVRDLISSLDGSDEED